MKIILYEKKIMEEAKPLHEDARHEDARAPPRAKKKKSPRTRMGSEALEKKTGGALLSRAPGRSTIAAGALNGRVREGNGC